MEDSLKKRYAIKLFANVITALFGAVLIAIVPKALGPIQYGQFVYLQNFFTKLIGFLDMGSSLAFFTKLSARHTRKELITFYFIYSFVVLIITLLFTFTVDSIDYVNTLFPSISNHYIYLGLFFAFFTWLTQIFVKISDAYALTVSVELIKIGHKIVSLILLLLFIYTTSFDLKLYFYFNYIALITLILILGWVFIKKDIFNRNILTLNFGFKKIAKEFIEYSHPLAVYSVAALAAGLFDIWLLQKVSGSEQTGFYGLAYSLASMCFLFTSAMTPIITREFSKSFEQNDLEHMRKLFHRYIPMLYSIAAFFAIFISIQSENVLMIFTDEKFKEAYLVLIIMAFYPIHQTYGQLSGSIFYAVGQTKQMRNIGIVSLLLGVILTFLFLYIFHLGAIGLAYKMVITQLIGVLIQLYLNTKFLDMDLKYFLSHQLYSLLFFVLLAWLSSHILTIESPLFSFLISGFMYTLLVIIFTYIFPQVFATTRSEITTIFNKAVNVIKK